MVGRAEIICAILGMLSFIVGSQGIRSSADSTKREMMGEIMRTLFAVLLAYLAILGKETGVAFFPLLVAYDMSHSLLPIVCPTYLLLTTWLGQNLPQRQMQQR